MLVCWLFLKERSSLELLELLLQLESYSNKLIFNLFVSLVMKSFIHNIDLIQSHLQNLITSGSDNMLIIHKLALCRIFL